MCNLFAVVLASLMMYVALRDTGISEAKAVVTEKVQHDSEYCGWKRYTNVNMIGHDFVTGAKYRPGSFTACQAKCLATKGCESVVWGLSTNPTGFAGDCYLKTSDNVSRFIMAPGFNIYVVPNATACTKAKYVAS